MFERFAQDARDAVVLAQQIAREAADDHIGSAHVLVGAACAGDSLARRSLAWLGAGVEDVRAAALAQEHGALDASALAGLGIDLEHVRTAAERTFGAGALDRAVPRRRRGHLPFDSCAKKVLEVALREAIAGGERRIDTGHLLLATLRMPESAAHRALLGLGLDPAEIRQTVLAQRRRDDDGRALAVV